MEKTEETKVRIVEKLNGAIARYASACASLKAAGTPLQSSQFANKYSKLRCEFLQATVRFYIRADHFAQLHLQRFLLQ